MPSIPVTDPQPGDLAWHKDGLDPREVTRVTKRSVWLKLLGDVFGPFPRKNYTFTRYVK